MKPATTCCFTGHRKLPQERMEGITTRLSCEIDNLISRGVTDFISGGALGFDQVAATLVLQKKRRGSRVRLIFALPCTNQDRFWNAGQKERYRELLAEADEIIYVSREYEDGCMQKRNRFMVERSAYCICALLDPCSGTGQTVKYAKQRVLRVVNVMEMDVSGAAYR